MTPIWRPSRLVPERVHLLSANGLGRCGADVGPPLPEPARCAVCLLLDDGIGAPPRVRARIDQACATAEHPIPARLSALAAPGLDDDRAAMRAAADALGVLGTQLTDVHIELECALRSISEPGPTHRAHLVRYQLREAMVALEVTIAAYAQAEETLRLAG
jgi:hypothetical protein